MHFHGVRNLLIVNTSVFSAMSDCHDVYMVAEKSADGMKAAHLALYEK